jgi:anti-sigma factor RsiW
MTVTCRVVLELLLELVANELADEVRICVEEHISECPLCHARVETYRITIRLPLRLAPAEVPTTLLDRFRAAMRAKD